MKKSNSQRLQQLVLILRRHSLFSRLFAAVYDFAARFFTRKVLAMRLASGASPVCTVFVRRGRGRGEDVPGASDLDFFLVLNELSSQEEMQFLKDFWIHFRRWKRFFPFLGETLMADRNEFVNWHSAPTVRSFESKFSWRWLGGEKISLEAATLPALRDVFSECSKCYWALLKPLLRQERLGFKAYSAEALEFRHAAKAALDLFRLHYSFGKTSTPDNLDALWRASRAELSELLPAEYGNLKQLLPLLHLSDPLPSAPELWDILASAAERACLRLHEMAVRLGNGGGEKDRAFTPLEASGSAGPGGYSLAVRELFAERLILRYPAENPRIVIADETTHVFFLFSDFGADLYGRVLTDLRSAGASFHSSSVALPLTELTFRELERSSFLDSPFHSFFRQQVIRVGENGRVVSSAYQCHTQNLPQNVLSKTFVEVSLALRFQPPPELTYVVENLLTLVLQLRVAEEDGIVPVDFYSALDLYSRKHPARADYLKQALGSLLSLPQPQEAIFWAEVDAALARLSPSAGRRASALAAQISPLRVTDSKAEWRGPKATDLWIQLSPFLRLEMNAMRERYLEIPGVFRV